MIENNKIKPDNEINETPFQVIWANTAYRLHLEV